MTHRRVSVLWGDGHQTVLVPYEVQAVLEAHREQLHALISDALWIEQYSDFMESSCEMADWVLEQLGVEPIRDGVGPWPDHHHSSLAADAERTVNTHRSAK